MNKTFILSLLVIALVGGGFYFMRQNSASPLSQETSMMEEEKMMGNEAMMEDESMMGEDTAEMMEGEEKIMDQDSMMTDHGTYIDYSAQSFEDNKAKKRILFFYAAWCPTCRPADANFKANLDKLPENVVLFRVNYDTEDGLKEKYNITYQHTFIQVDEEGNQITRWNGGQIDELLGNIN